MSGTLLDRYHKTCQDTPGVWDPPEQMPQDMPSGSGAIHALIVPMVFRSGVVRESKAHYT